DRLYLQDQIPDEALDAEFPPYYRPPEGSTEYEYLMERRRALGGPLPCRRYQAKALPAPKDGTFADLLSGSGGQAVSTTMGFARLMRNLMRDEGIGPRVVPIIPDEARTFGMDSLFPIQKIYSPHGQTYTSVDQDLMLSYKESETGQILHEGINEAGSTASFTAAGSAYATHGEAMIPIYIFYSMFGFQRTGDSFWAAADQLSRGFVLGATAGRTTLNGEGLQHEDGHSMLIAATNPAVVSYDPAFGFELGHIVRDGLLRMTGEDPADRSPDVFYYLTLYNEPYVQPAEPDGVDVAGILAGLYRYAPASDQDSGPRAQILASGVGVPWAVRAQALLAEHWNVSADVWSVTSWTELRRQAQETEDWNLLHPDETPRTPYVAERLVNAPGPIVAVSDWMRAVPDLLAPYLAGEPGRYASLGTDGFGLSDTRPALRRYFRVDAESITVRTLASLVIRGEVPPEVVGQAIEKYHLEDPSAAKNVFSEEGGGE
ncbi:MAG: pyruvate dehydrogenase (acetyl-transferring), homodimeric type, partial [Actinomycetota bacterium]|nr:pyruvate dehydrogenase (acetyl-transferring), homodimeric type [Actinomycetota bacterium]